MSASTRPVIAQPDDDGKARAAVEALVADLQAGWDRHDAQIADRRFSADIAWGSPYGATVQGFDTLFAIHQRLKKENRGGPRARYVIDHVLPISADVIVAQVPIHRCVEGLIHRGKGLVLQYKCARRCWEDRKSVV